MYDWANSAYSTFQITILMLYLQQVVLPGPPGQIAYGYGIGISTLFAAVLSPILGAVADAHASKRFWLSVMTFAGAGAGVAMYFLPVEMSWVFVGLFFITSLSFELAWGLYNAFLPDPGEILDTTVGQLRTAYDVDVLGAVVAAQVAAPVLRTAGTGTLLFTSGGFADHPVPVLASLSMGKAALRSAATLIAAGVKEDGIHAATVTIAGSVVRGTAFDPDKIAELFWTAHTDPTDAWQTEYRFTGA